MIHLKVNRNLSIPEGENRLEGDLCIPSGCHSLVIFVHGSGSSRLSKRNKIVAEELHDRHIGTLLFDLLTKEEEEHYENRFNIELLTERLILATNYMRSLPECKGLTFGYFGASTGAAAALKAAAALTNVIDALVLRGGRSDLAIGVITKVKAATLLIVGDLDFEILFINSQVYKTLTCKKKLEVIGGATHLFEEPGKLKEVADYAADWFNLYLGKKKPINLSAKL
ncbi:MAG: alpha/beta hydrolase [bacterium]|nr:alpha/beta hydrolase [bacterium]